MKKSLINSALLLIGIFTCMSCEDTTELEGKTIRDIRPGFSYQITEENALKYMSNYQHFVDSVGQEVTDNGGAPENSLYLTHGALVDLDELRRILRFADSLGTNSEEVAIMMGVMDSDTTELILCLETVNNDATQLWYFDFTRPCPTSCPTWLSEPVQF